MGVDTGTDGSRIEIFGVRSRADSGGEEDVKRRAAMWDVHSVPDLVLSSVCKSVDDKTPAMPPHVCPHSSYKGPRYPVQRLAKFRFIVVVQGVKTPSGRPLAGADSLGRGRTSRCRGCSDRL